MQQTVCRLIKAVGCWPGACRLSFPLSCLFHITSTYIVSFARYTSLLSPVASTSMYVYVSFMSSIVIDLFLVIPPHHLSCNIYVHVSLHVACDNVKI